MIDELAFKNFQIEEEKKRDQSLIKKHKDNPIKKLRMAGLHGIEVRAVKYWEKDDTFGTKGQLIIVTDEDRVIKLTLAGIGIYMEVDPNTEAYRIPHTPTEEDINRAYFP